MEWVETTGITLEEAKDRALDRLGVAADEAEFEVLAEPKREMFGLRKTEARLRARVKPATPPAKSERRDRQRPRKRKGGSGKQDSGRQESGNQESSKQESSKQASRGGQGRSSNERSNKNTRSDRSSRDDAPAQADAVSESGTPQEAEDRPEKAARSDRGGRDDGGRGRGSGNRRGKHEPSPDAMTLAEQASVTEDFLQGLMDAMGLDARVVSDIEDDSLTVSAQGLNLGLAIGPRGETVRAITELARTMIQRLSEGDAEGSLTIDVGGYRERRRSFLSDFAAAQAALVREDGKSRVFEPMGSADRKMVHDVLADIDGVDTTSEGDDPYRRVVIVPADA